MHENKFYVDLRLDKKKQNKYDNESIDAQLQWICEVSLLKTWIKQTFNSQV